MLFLSKISTNKKTVLLWQQQVLSREYGKSGCYITTRPLAQASVKSVRRAQIIDHLPVWWVRFSLPRNYLNCEHCVLHSILPRKNLSINRLFLFTKFYIPNCLINWHWKARLDFLNRQIRLPPGGNYITHKLAKSYSDGHYRGIGDQVTVIWHPKTAPETHKLQGSHKDSFLKNIFEM